MGVIDSILRSNEYMESIMGDILRVLALCMGALWIDELYDEVNAFRISLGDSLISRSDVDEAIGRLRDIGLITIEDRIKAGEFGEGVRSKLVSLKDLGDVYIYIRLDDRYNRYKELLREG